MPSNSILEQKKAVVADLAEKLKNSPAGVVVNYQGITVDADTKMRKALREAGVDSAVLELKKYEALVQMSNGTAAKLIIPTDAVSAVTNNAIFSETTGLGDTTKEAPKPKKTAKGDPCCD